MRILITNDDGVDSPGIHELALQIERAGYDAIVVAPDHDASGTGTSVGGVSRDPVKVTPSAIEGFKGEVYGIAGPPALCVLAGYMRAFGPTPDIIVSGINAGMNPGRAVTHSGTVGAALAGQNYGMRALAVSLDATDSPWQWASAASLTVDVLPELLKGPTHAALNLNVPCLPLDEIKGIRWATLAPYGTFRGTMQRDNNQLMMTYEPTGYVPEAHTDIGTVRAGYAALTSIHGSSEVWGDEGHAGEVFHPDHGIHAASAGHEIRPGRATFVPARYDPDTYLSD